MSGINQFKALATGGGANALTPAAYAALTALLANGYQTGTASSQQINTTLRQATFVITALAQAIVDMTGVNVNDDGVIANFENQLLAMLQQAPYSSANAAGVADVITAAMTPAITSLVNGQSVLVRAGSANATTTPSFAPNSMGARTIVKGSGQPLLAGDIAGAGHWLELQYDLALDKWVLQNPAKGVASVASALGYTPYNASNPAGYISSVGAALGYTPYDAANPAGYLNVGLGISQSWQNVAGSRAANTTYTNSTGRPIMVLVSYNMTGAAPGITIVLNGLAPIQYGGAFYANPTSFADAVAVVIPPGNTYSVSTFSQWYELR